MARPHAASAAAPEPRRDAEATGMDVLGSGNAALGFELMAASLVAALITLALGRKEPRRRRR